jgi:acetolactate synthase-1/2/3 large subunit
VSKYRGFFVSVFDYICVRTKKLLTTAEYLAKRLRKEGLRRFFGIPGGPSISYLEAFRKEGIEFILTSHEASAAVMADVTARLTGVAGVCHATYGPGATNLSTGVGGALLDRSPVLALTSEMPDAWLGRTAQMNIDHQAFFKPVTKATFRLSAGNATGVIDESLEIANSEYPGPVYRITPDLAETDHRLRR